MTWVLRSTRGVVIPVVLILVWQVLSATGAVSSVFLPTPQEVLEAGRAMWSAGSLPDALRWTVERALVGWAIAVVMGIAVSIVLSQSQILSRALSPIFEFLRVVPPVAFIPAFLAVLGLGRTMELTVVAAAATWPILLGALHGIRSCDPLMLEAVHMCGFGRMRKLRSIQLPSALVSTLPGIRLSIAIAFVVAIVAEMITTEGGIGALVVVGASQFASAQVYAGVLVVGAVAAACGAVLIWVESWVVRRMTGSA